jgi:hypothetical protein
MVEAKYVAEVDKENFFTMPHDGVAAKGVGVRMVEAVLEV